MSKTVYKYPLRADSDITELGLSGRVLHFAEQHGRLVLWAHHTNTQPMLRKFQVVGTGQPVPENSEYIGSTLTSGGHFVFHLYEVMA